MWFSNIDSFTIKVFQVTAAIVYRWVLFHNVLLWVLSGYDPLSVSVSNTKLLLSHIPLWPKAVCHFWSYFRFWPKGKFLLSVDLCILQHSMWLLLTDDIKAICGSMQRERRNIVRIEAQFVSFANNSISYFLDVNWLILPCNIIMG